ncbi:hypothetical protein FB451DRAFT_1167557 [Mycena latifolia]|nr:hypothetical protein FB451DRAFT_1167557 [Mycena latifolia]
MYLRPSLFPVFLDPRPPVSFPTTVLRGRPAPCFLVPHTLLLAPPWPTEREARQSTTIYPQFPADPLMPTLEHLGTADSTNAVLTFLLGWPLALGCALMLLVVWEHMRRGERLVSVLIREMYIMYGDYNASDPGWLLSARRHRATQVGSFLPLKQLGGRWTKLIVATEELIVGIQHPVLAVVHNGLGAQDALHLWSVLLNAYSGATRVLTRPAAPLGHLGLYRTAGSSVTSPALDARTTH